MGFCHRSPSLLSLSPDPAMTYQPTGATEVRHFLAQLYIDSLHASPEELQEIRAHQNRLTLLYNALTANRLEFN
jgi:hypothetical protein